MAVANANVPSTISGPLIVTNDYTDGYCFVDPRVIACDSTNMVLTRVAAGDWSLKRTATGAETYNFIVNLNYALPSRLGTTFANAAGGPTSTTKGIKVTAIELYYQITVQALTTHTVTGLQKNIYANNVANAVTTLSATTGTLATATQANPYLSTVTVTTPVYISTSSTYTSLEFQAVMANNGVLSLFGAGIKFTYNLN